MHQAPPQGPAENPRAPDEEHDLFIVFADLLLDAPSSRAPAHGVVELSAVFMASDMIQLRRHQVRPADTAGNPIVA